MEQKKESDKRGLPNLCTTDKRIQRKYIVILISFALLFVISLFAINREESRSEEFVAPSFDKNALPMKTADLNDETYSILTIAEGYQVGICGEPEEKDGRVTVLFSNPQENNIWMRLRILDENNKILVETGIIRPGQYIENVSMNQFFKNSEAPVIMEILGYEPDTYYSEGKVELKTKIRHMMP